MNPRPFITAAALAEQDRLARATAARAVVADIESSCVAEDVPGSRHRWLDTRGMFSEHEHATIVIEINRCVLAYARLRGLIAFHPQHAHLVRITCHP